MTDGSKKKIVKFQKTRHPDLIGKTPAEQEAGLPKFPAEWCGARTKSCPHQSGGCGYRYKGGDKSLVCPECGYDRRCSNPKGDEPRCRLHGGSKNRVQSPYSKYRIPMVILEDFSRLLADPQLLNLSAEIASVSSRTQQIFDMMEDNDPSLAIMNLLRGHDIIEEGLKKTDFFKIRKGFQIATEAMDPTIIQARAWVELRNNFELQTKMVDKQREWIAKEAEAMPREQVLEMFILVVRRAQKYITNKADRAAFRKDMAQLLPTSSGK
jgi:hypothetical protein